MPWKEILKEDIIFDPKVQTYCINPKFKCPNYGHSWACPPEAPYLEDHVTQFERFFLIYYKSKLIKNEKFGFKKYELMRDKLEEEIIQFIEVQGPNFKEIQILWDGHCRKCEKENKTCSIEDQLPCRYPNEIKYSMEAIGINVTETVRKNKLDIEWPPKNHIFRFGLICVK